MFLNSKTIAMSSSQTVTNNTNTLFGSDAEHTPNNPNISTLDLSNCVKNTDVSASDDRCLLKYNKYYYKHCNLGILICSITHVHTLSLSYSNSRTRNIIDVKDLVDEYTSELSYCNKITYAKKLVPYYTKKAKHFSQKRVFHHKK
jgi:hypothetical protein